MALNTGFAAYWAAVGEREGSVSLRATNESNSGLWKKYASTETGAPPALIVTYNHAPITPVSVSPANGAHITGSTTTLSATYADADGTTGSVAFGIWNPAGQMIWSAWSPPVCANWCQTSVASPALADGWYYLQTAGWDGQYVSAFSAPQWFFLDTVPPPAPTILAPAPGAYVTSPVTVSARYSEPYTWSGYVLFNVITSTGGQGPAVWSGLVTNGGTATVTLPALAPGTYTLYVLSSDGALSGWAPTRAFNVASVPGAPTGLSARAGAESAQVSWSGAPTGGAPVTNVSVSAADSAGGSTQVACTASCLTAKTLFVPGLVAGHAYRFTATATNAIGVGPPSGPASTPSDPNPLVILATTLLTPTDVRAASGDMHATVTWTPGLLDLPAITTYTVNVYQDGVQAPVATRNAGIATTFDVDGLRNSFGYSFAVVANTILGPAPESTRSLSVVPAGRPFPAAITAAGH